MHINSKKLRDRFERLLLGMHNTKNYLTLKILILFLSNQNQMSQNTFSSSHFSFFCLLHLILPPSQLSPVNPS